MLNIYKNINSKLSNAKSVIRYLPIVLKSGKGIRVTDINGKTYLDCVASAGTIPFGHNHPIINEASGIFQIIIIQFKQWIFQQNYK